MLHPGYNWDSDSSHGNDRLLSVNNEKLLSGVLKVDSDSADGKLVLSTLTLACRAMNSTVQKQLSDFLKEGQFGFGQQPSKDDLQRTHFAHLTNLGCEHHFGDLDSSQRRRPRASMHHHSSVQLLKRNRMNMMEWLEEMPGKTRNELLKSARKG